MQKPNLKEIFYALTNEATYPDWDKQTLEEANPEDRKKIVDLLKTGLPFIEAEIEVENLLKGGENYE